MAKKYIATTYEKYLTKLSDNQISIKSYMSENKRIKLVGKDYVSEYANKGVSIPETGIKSTLEIKMDWVDELLLRVEKINLEYEWNKIYE